MSFLPYCGCLITLSATIDEFDAMFVPVELPIGTCMAEKDCKFCLGTGVNQEALRKQLSISEDVQEHIALGKYLVDRDMGYYQQGLDLVVEDQIQREEVAEAPITVTVRNTAADPLEVIEHAFRQILLAVGEDPDREGLVDTPRRVARMYMNELCVGLHADLKKEITTTFSATHDEIVLVKDIDFWSLCEHHFVPFFGQAHVAYIPRGRVVGISKLARCVEVASKRPNIQEELTQRIADAIDEALRPLGVAVIIEAEHLCMTMRGVRKPGAKTVTSVMKGAFMNNPSAREELMRLVYGRLG